MGSLRLELRQCCNFPNHGHFGLYTGARLHPRLHRKEIMGKSIRAGHPICNLLLSEIEGFDSLAELALDIRWPRNHSAGGDAVDCGVSSPPLGMPRSRTGNGK
jgi:hypothetical protein